MWDLYKKGSSMGTSRRTLYGSSYTLYFSERSRNLKGYKRRSETDRVKGEGERQTRALEKTDFLFCTRSVSLLSDSKHPRRDVARL